MGFFKTRFSGATRRHDRLWKQNVKKLALACAVLALVTGLAAYGATHGVLAQAGGWLHDKFLTTTAALGFKVDRILITGRAHIPQDEVLSHLAIDRGVPVFGIDLPLAQQKLKDLSWAQDVRISRRLPDTIVVDITERLPAALWQHRKTLSLIDAQGHVLHGGDLSAWRHLPLVVGETAPAHVSDILSLLQAEPAVARVAASATRIGSRRWDLHLKNGMDVRLPEYDAELALSRLAQAIAAEGLLQKDIKVVDLRLPDRLVVGPVADKPKGVSG
jgi:cell division protein FtsQ